MIGTSYQVNDTDTIIGLHRIIYIYVKKKKKKKK